MNDDDHIADAAIEEAIDEGVNPIEVRGLRSCFGERVIHDNLDLTVKPGEVFGLVGGSGAGKSVLLRTLIGLKDPDGGEVKIFGQNLERPGLTARPRSAAACGRRERSSWRGTGSERSPCTPRPPPVPSRSARPWTRFSRSWVRSPR